jgi:uncharacterized glyoxalase superfamily protein PhnB
MTTHDARISPVFRYTHAHAAIDWLVRAYGFTRHEAHEGGHHSIAHAELRLGPGAIGLSSAGPEVAGNPWTTVRQGIYVCTAAVDAAHDRARAAGADIAQPIRNTDYGAREFSVRDPEGHLWSFGTYGMSSTDTTSNIFLGLQCRDGQRALAWLEKALGFERTLEVPGAGGIVEHAELRLGRGVVMVSSAPPSVGDGHTDRQYTYVKVSDPDAHYRHARAADATIVREPHATPYGARAYYTRDIEGFMWGFSTYAPEASR